MLERNLNVIKQWLNKRLRKSKPNKYEVLKMEKHQNRLDCEYRTGGDKLLESIC